jgi:hypothetical protein
MNHTPEKARLVRMPDSQSARGLAGKQAMNSCTRWASQWHSMQTPDSDSSGCMHLDLHSIHQPVIKASACMPFQMHNIACET